MPADPLAPKDDKKTKDSPAPTVKELKAEAAKRAPVTPPPGYILSSYTPSVLQQMRDTVANSAIGHSLESAMPRVADVLNLHPSERSGTPEYKQHKTQLLAPEYLTPVAMGVMGSVIPDAEKKMLDTTANKDRVSGALTATGELTSGKSMATMAGIGAAAAGTAGVVNPASAQLLSRLVSGGFTLDMLHGLYQQHKEYRKAVDSGDMAEAHKIQGEMGVTGIMALLTGKHALTAHPFTPVASEDAPVRERTNVLHRNTAGEVRQAKGQAPSVWLSPDAWKSFMGSLYPGENAAATHGVNLPANEHLHSFANDPQLAAANPAFGEVQQLLAKAHENAGNGGIAIANNRDYVPDLDPNTGKFKFDPKTGLPANRSIQANVNVMREELNHTWQRSLANGNVASHLKPEVFETLHQSIPKGMQEHLVEQGYDGTSAPEMVTETAAKLMDGRPERFGVKPEEAVEFLDKYFKQVSDQHGPKSLQELQHVRGIAADAKARAIGEYSGTGSGQDNSVVSGVATGGQGGSAEGVPAGGEEVSPKKDITEAFNDFMARVGTRLAREQHGQGILDEMDEKGESPAAISKQFWDKTYFNMPAEAQTVMQRQLKALTGMEPGDVLASKRNPDGSYEHIPAKDWADIADGLVGDKVEHLDGGERGYVAMMRDAIDRFKPDNKSQLPSPQDTSFNREKEKPTWYLKSERLIGDKMKGPQPAEDVHKMLLSGGIKPEEMHWTGLDDFLKSKGKEKVTPEEIREHLANNNLQIHEVNKTDAPPAPSANLSHGEDGWHWYDEETGQDLTGTSFSSREEALQPIHAPRGYKYFDSETNKYIGGQPQDNPTKYSDYQLPGGKSYREMLITMPPTSKILEQWRVLRPDGQTESTFGNETAARQQAERLGEGYWVDRKPDLNLEGGFKSSHWNEPNILAHVRMNDRTIPARTDIDIPDVEKRIMDAVGAKDANHLGSGSPYSALRKGVIDEAEAAAYAKHKGFREPELVRKADKRLLHIEEVQSDWHQRGRSKGYRGDEPMPVQEKYKIEERDHDWVAVGEDGKEISAVGKGVVRGREEAEQYLKRYLDGIHRDYTSSVDRSKAQKVPDAPFKKNWHEMALRRILKKAVDDGYDAISWTGGADQADRYSLSKKVARLEYNPASRLLNGISHDGELVVNQNVSPEKLPDYIGKEAAKKLLETPTEDIRSKYEIHNNKPEVPGHVLEGTDLDVGGQGMKGFYDKIIPDYLNKFGKKFNAKVSETNIPVPADKRMTIRRGINGWEVESRLDENIGREHSVAYFSDDDFGGRDGAQKAAQKDAEERSALKKKVQYLPITPEMRKSVAEEGVPLFNREQVKTPEFKQWFGESKAVDEKGDPKPVYHGTSLSFDSFDPSKTGTRHDSDTGDFGKAIYFADKPETAHNYATFSALSRKNEYKGPEVSPDVIKKIADGWEGDASLKMSAQGVLKSMSEGKTFREAMAWSGTPALAEKLGGNNTPVGEERRQSIMPVYLKADKPLTLGEGGSDWTKLYSLALDTNGRTDGNQLSDMQEAWFNLTPEEQAKKIQDAGYDSVHDLDYGQWAVFEPTQIKSAIGNSGAFDPSDPNILRNREKTEDDKENDSPSATGTESKAETIPEQVEVSDTKTAPTVVPIQGGTTLASAPKQERPIEKVHASVPYVVATHVSVPLQVALKTTPVLTKQVLPLAQIKAMAAQHNPQYQTRSVRDLMREAKERFSNSIVP